MTTIDLVTVSDISKVNSSLVLDVGKADHNVVYAKLNLKWKRSPPKMLYAKNYKGLDQNTFKEDTRNGPWWICSTFENVDDVTYAWSTMYDGTMTEHINEQKKE